MNRNKFDFNEYVLGLAPFVMVGLAWLLLLACVSRADAQYYSSRIYYGSAYQQRSAYQSPNYSVLRSKMLDILKEQQRYEGRLLANQQEHQHFVQELEAMGFQGDYRMRAYGLARAYGLYDVGAGQLPYAQQGSTVYGYRSVAERWGGIDDAAALAAGERLVKGAQSLDQQATANFLSIVRERAKASASLEETKGLVESLALAVEALRSVSESETTTTHSLSVGQGAQPTGVLVVAPMATITAKCLQCHTGAEAKGGVDLTQYPSFSSVQRRAVLDSIVREDKRMPLKGDALSPQEVMGFVGDLMP